MSAPNSLRRALEGVLFRLPRGRQAYDLYAALKVLRRQDPGLGAIGEKGGRPLPGVLRRISVAGTPSAAWFLASGQAGADGLREALAANGHSLEESGAILDFGVGCGRVIRHLEPLAGRVRLCGVDINSSSIAWSRRHLPFAEFAVCPLAPPLAYPSDSFGLVYALSVFTHLPEDLQLAWIAEMRRLLRPGGLLFLTVHGVSYLGDLAPEEQREFAAGNLVVRRAATAGSNLCGAYHPAGWVEEHFLPGFRLLEHRPEGALGNPHQDFYLLQSA